MLDTLAMIASVLISLVILAGFVAVAVILLFELGTMLLFWMKHAFMGSSSRPAMDNPRRKLSNRPTS